MEHEPDELPREQQVEERHTSIPVEDEGISPLGVSRVSEGKPNRWQVSGVDVPRRLVPVTDLQVEVIVAAQQGVNAAQERLNAILLGVLTGHGIREAQVVRITDERQLEVFVSRNGK